LVVPSRGSTIHVGSSVSSVIPKAAVVSSPMNYENQQKRTFKRKTDALFRRQYSPYRSIMLKFITYKVENTKVSC